PGGPFDQCSIQGLCQCNLLGGVFQPGPLRTCTPNPCETTTTTTTTTSTTLMCQYDGTSCVGSCGRSETSGLLDTILRTCGCAVPRTCQSTVYPTCGGNCPSGFACQAVKVGTTGGCRCVVASATCPEGTGSTCTQGCQIETVCADGVCPPGEACLASLFG